MTEDTTRERVTWNGEMEDFVEEGDADREEGRPKPRCRLGLVGGEMGSGGELAGITRGTVVGLALRRTKTEPSLQPIPIPCESRLPPGSANGARLGGLQKAMVVAEQDESASSTGFALALPLGTENDTESERGNCSSFAAIEASPVDETNNELEHAPDDDADSRLITRLLENLP